MQTPILIPAELNSGEEICSFRSNCLENTLYNNLCIRLGTWKVWRSESKPFQSRSKGEIPGQARRKERLSRSELKQAFLIDSDAELFMYSIQCIIRFGSWKVRHLNRALFILSTLHFINRVVKLSFYPQELKLSWKQQFCYRWVCRNTV